MSQIKTVALAGATGNLGPTILNSLVKGGFEVTVLSRTADAKVPAGIKVKAVDYASLDSLKEALTGIDAVVITLGPAALKAQLLLFDAAAAVGVKRVLPSEFGFSVNDNLKALPFFAPKGEASAHIEKLAKSTNLTYTQVITGPFLDWCLDYGIFDVTKDGTANIYDGGNEKFTVSTLSRVGEAVAAVLQHPDETANREVFVSSRTTTQNEILAAAKKAGKTDWKYSEASAAKTLEGSLAAFQSDPSNMEAWALPMLKGIIYGGPAYNSDFEPVDNKLFGFKTLSDAEFEEVIKGSLL